MGLEEILRVQCLAPGGGIPQTKDGAYLIDRATHFAALTVCTTKKCTHPDTEEILYRVCREIIQWDAAIVAAVASIAVAIASVGGIRLMLLCQHVKSKLCKFMTVLLLVVVELCVSF